MNKINEDLLIEKLNNHIARNKTAFCNHEISNSEIVDNVFKHIDKDKNVCLLLRGSYANARNNSYSDVDVVAVQSDGNIDDVSFHDNNGVRYHTNVFNKTFLDVNNDKHVYRYYYGMKKIYDPYNVCDKLINDIKDYEIYNCSKVDKLNTEGRDYLYKLLEYVDCDDEVLSMFVKAKILRESPAFLANYNGFNLIGFKTTIDCLIRDNYKLALIYGKALDKKSGKKEIKKWLDEAFNGLCGLNVLNLDFSSSKKSYEIYINDISMYDLYSDYNNFIEYLKYLNPSGNSIYEFFDECNKKTPKLFNMLKSLISD